jgi:hypothetical protein
VISAAPQRVSPRRRRKQPSFALVLTLFVLYVLLLVATACSEAADAATPVAPTIQLTMASVQQISEFTPSLADAQSRVLPTLADAASAAKLNTELTLLMAALNARDSRAAAQQIDAARATLASYPAAARALDAIELSVIDIVLDRAAQLLGLPAQANRSGG